MSLRYNLDIKIVRSDREMERNRTRQYLTDVGIFFEPSSADTQAQNGVAERFGRTVMTKVRVM